MKIIITIIAGLCLTACVGERPTPCVAPTPGQYRCEYFPISFHGPCAILSGFYTETLVNAPPVAGCIQLSSSRSDDQCSVYRSWRCSPAAGVTNTITQEWHRDADWDRYTGVATMDVYGPGGECHHVYEMECSPCPGGVCP